MSTSDSENRPQKKRRGSVSEGGFTPEEEAMPLGAPHPAPIMLAPSTLPNPYRPPEDQFMEMRPVIVGPPGYGSPDPLTSQGRLTALEMHPLRETHINEDYGAGYGANLTAQETLAPSPGPGTGEDETEDEVDATDGAEEFAAENDVDLADVEGTGKDGRVTKADVEKFVSDRDQS